MMFSMATKTKLILYTTAGSVVLGAYLLLRKWRNRSKLYNVIPKTIHVVTQSSQWDAVYPTIITEIKSCSVLGIDCEWVPLTDRHTRPVSLLQLCTASGTCVLIRLLQMDTVPETLRDILADKTILKTGVVCLGDAQKLMKDHALLVRGCVDLRHLALRARIISEGFGLKALTKSILGADLDKNLLVRAGNWEIPELTPEQIKYAAMDALVGVKIFLVLLGRKLGYPPEMQYEPIKECDWSRVLSMCQGIIEANFRNPNRVHRHGERSGGAPSSSSSSTRAYVHRKRPLYHNCQLRAPDGQLLCTCDVKKAEWYLEKGLGEKISDDPLTIQLNFEPSGRPRDQNNYYLQDKQNICVVCGKGEAYIRKNIVPREYRIHFPGMLKEHRSHDVVLMCSDCHQRCGTHDSRLKERLARECDAPLGCMDGAKYKTDQGLQKVKSAAKALLNTRANIPEWRKSELREMVRLYYGVDTLTDSLLEQASLMETKLPNDEYTPHGHRVVQYYAEHDGLIQFEKMWRQHFLDIMKPEHLPALWSVDHSHNELEDMDETLRTVIDASHS